LKKRFENLKPGVLTAKTAAWFQQRIDFGPAIALMAKKTVPAHRHSWTYLLGGAALFLFALQVVTGPLLMLYYQPAEQTAHQSVQRIMTDVPFGWLVRSMHVWGAHLFVACVGMHFLTVMFTRAYRKPRELTWTSGMLLLLLTLTLGFSGYLLPWNELSYSATLVGTQMPGTLPGAGDFIVHFLRGGDHVTGDTITRFFAAHVVIVPLVFGLVLLVHLALVQVHGMSTPLGMPRAAIKDHRPFLTEFVLVDACAWLLLLGTVATLAVLLPAETGRQADPLNTAPEGIKPEWYFLFMFQTLKYVPETLGVAWFALGALFFLLLPFIDRAASREEKKPGLTALLLVLVLYAAIFEIAALWPEIKALLMSLFTSGAEHSREPLTAETLKRNARSLVSLALLWSVIGFLIYYLRQLLKENTRLRKLYANRPNDSAKGDG